MKTLLRWMFPFLFSYTPDWEAPAIYRFARRAGGIVHREAEQ